jgi:AraC-like DNA-binding protein
MANEVMAQLCEQQCESLLASLTREHGLVEQVRRLIINRPGRVPTPDSIAQDLNMSYRTLRRKLSQQGTSFKAILGEVRMGLAGEYMKNTNLSTQEIAYLLGYSEASNFHRAFKLWFDQTPGEYRRNG